ncbi:MAG: acylneuraminate cytidylyltransferase [Bacteroidota bacterium]
MSTSTSSLHSPSQPAHILALIPARGGSKSIPRKNVKRLGGHPLIAYSIAAAHQATLPAGYTLRVVVSTDDQEIAEAARAYGAEVPFVRPSELAQDDTIDFPVFEQALRWLMEHEGYQPDLVAQLRPTSPLRPPSLLADAVAAMHARPDADSLRAVIPSGQNPFKMWRIEGARAASTLTPLLTPSQSGGQAEPYNQPRQSLPATYWQTGHLDLIRPRTIFEQRSMSGRVILPLVLDPRYTHDLDTPLDWQRTEDALAVGDLPVVVPKAPHLKKHTPFDPGTFDAHSFDLVAFDFDGVFTDNRVYVNEQGVESVVCHRGDGHGVGMLRRAGVPMMVLSTEVNPVVSARCRKLRLDVQQGLGLRKGEALRTVCEKRGIPLERVCFVGNDVNDADCLRMAGLAVVPDDAHPDVRPLADWVLPAAGGQGAIRAFADLWLARLNAVHSG